MARNDDDEDDDKRKEPSNIEISHACLRMVPTHAPSLHEAL
jgi:hypothetical protein